MTLPAKGGSQPRQGAPVRNRRAREDSAWTFPPASCFPPHPNGEQPTSASAGSRSSGKVDEEEVPRRAAGLTPPVAWQQPVAENREISGCLPDPDHGLCLSLLNKRVPYKTGGQPPAQRASAVVLSDERNSPGSSVVVPPLGRQRRATSPLLPPTDRRENRCAALLATWGPVQPPPSSLKD
jgi:hypothetical protein